MKKIALLTLAAVLGRFSTALASSPSSCPPGGARAASPCSETQCAEGDSAAAQTRVVAAELTRLVARYVSDASIRSELLRVLKSDPERPPETLALANVCFELGRYLEAFSEADRACFQRVLTHFKC